VDQIDQMPQSSH
jgi:hypothetical protein